MERIGNGTDTRNLLDIEYDKLWPFPETEGVLGGDIIFELMFALFIILFVIVFE